MESIVNALARARDSGWPQPQAVSLIDMPQLNISEHVLLLSPKVLKANRVASFDGADLITQSFDVLRNTCTRDLKPRVTDCPVFSVTAPKSGCGATTTAINLAFALARLQKGAVMLADLTPPGEGWWRRLGLDQMGVSAPAARDTVMTLEVADTLVHAANLSMLVHGKSRDEIREAVRNWTTVVRRDLGPVSIVLDLPPLLSDDRASAFVSEADLVLLVLATGRSTMAELETSKNYLHNAASVQLVLNKARRYDI